MRPDQTGCREQPRGKRRTRARALARAAAGGRARASSPRDRGTVLLMVLGVLALMAIIMVVYAAIGKGDRISSAAAVRAQRIDGQVEQIADYFGDVLRRDVFATYPQEDGRTNNALSTMRLEASDIPYTDPMMLSQALRPADQTRTPVQEDPAWAVRKQSGFYAATPEGTIKEGWRGLQPNPINGANRRDPRTPSDPYLASTEPIFRNRESSDWNWQVYGPNEDYLNLRDWAHLSNFAPSGNFVNLWALRNNFRAESGFQRDPNNRARLSALLTLINPATGYSYPAHNANQDPDVNVAGSMRAGDLKSFVQLNRPADWTNDQIGVFRTLAELPTGNGSGNAPFGVDDPEFMPYQYADADGDGFYDSRWFELVDIFDGDNPRPLIAGDGRARLFVAARCVDLSALVNVNVASDFSFEPKRYFVASRPPTGGDMADPLRPIDRPTPLRRSTGQADPGPRVQTPPSTEAGNWINYRFSVENSLVLPTGLTPADVDLHRLLRLSDSYYAYTQANMGVGYDDLPQPPAGAGLDVLAGDYRKYDPTNMLRNQVIGDAAYQALWNTRLASQPPDVRYIRPDQEDLATGAPPFIDTLKVAQQRYRYFENFGNRREPGRLSESGALNRYGQVFDEADELELRTFQGLNDPDRTSRLEAAVAGRTANEPDLYTLSPLRDNRATALERAGRDLPPRDLNNTAPGVNDEYRKALLASQIDIRRLLTTISGARPIVDNTLVTLKTNERGDIVESAPTELSEDAGSIKKDGSRLVSLMVETGNFSFDKDINATNDIPQTSSYCDFIENRNPPIMLANLARENILDDLGWFEPRPDDESRPWFYQRLDNQPPPTTQQANAQAPFPPSGTIDRGNQPPDAENYTISRLDLMREAFRAYLDCLLPYSQWGTDPRQLSQRNGPFPDAWDRDPAGEPIRPNLHYGGDPELAYQMAATMALNLRDAIDTDRQVALRTEPPAALEPYSGVSRTGQKFEYRDANLQTAVSLDLTPDAVARVTSRVPNSPVPYPNNGMLTGVDPLNAAPAPDTRAWNMNDSPSGYQRELNYPWPKLNPDNSATTTDDAAARTRLPANPTDVRSTGDLPATAVKRINRFGIEPQPFITQVSSMMLVVDTPYATDTQGEVDDETCPPPTPPIPGQPVIPPADCEITINVKRCISTGDCTNNPDFICYLIAFQLTNPFDTDIVLEPEDPSQNQNWYYIEYANRFYRLVPKDSRQPIDGMKRAIPESQRILRAGETKVFYATYPNSLKDISDRIRVIQRAASEPPLSDPAPSSSPEPQDEDGDITGLETTFARIAKHEFGDSCVNVAPMYPETSVAIGAAPTGNRREDVSSTHRLTNVDLFAINSTYTSNVLPLADGPYGENQRDVNAGNKRLLDDLPPIQTNGAWSSTDLERIKHDPRRRIYLWRVLRDPDAIDGDASKLPGQLRNAGGNTAEGLIRPRWNWIGNDLLLDRLYDPSPIPYVAGTGDPAPSPPYTSAEEDEITRAANGALVQALIKPFDRRLDDLSVSNNSSNISVDGTDATATSASPAGPDNTGFTLTSWVSITRPLNPSRERQGPTDAFGKDPNGRSPVGAMPPWCMEARPDNIYTPGFRTLAEDQPNGEFPRRTWSLNAVRRFFGIRSKLSYRSKGEDYYTPYYTRMQDFLDVHTKQSTTNSVADSSYSKYPSDYGTDNKKAMNPKFIDPELSVRFADRRGAKTLPPFDRNNPSVNTNAMKGDFRAAHSIVDIDYQRAANINGPAETDEFFNMPASAAPTTMKPRRFDQVAVEFHALPPDTTDSPEAQSTPSRALFSRVGDFLLPLAVGPFFDPAAGPAFSVSTTLTGINDEFFRRTARLDTQWTTLAEALATATDYYSGPKEQVLAGTGGTPVARRNLYYRFARDTRGQTPNNVVPMIPKGDRGQLVLDAWIPYLDYNPTLDAYQWAKIDPGSSTSLNQRRDAPLGNGIPMALNILDKFRVSGLPGETIPKPSDPRQCIDQNMSRPMRTVGTSFARTGRAAAYGSATQLVPGTININTAPMAVLRSIPLLSPSRDRIDLNNRNLRDGWLFDGYYDRPNEDPLALVTPLVVPSSMLGDPTDLANVNPPIPDKPSDRLWKPLNTGNVQQPWDVAASLAAYRDKIAMISRRFNNADPILIDYRDDRTGIPTTPDPRSGRDDAFQSNIEDPSQGGLRDGRGYKTVAEVMAVEIKRSTDARVIQRAQDDGRPNSRPIDVENSITRMAYDGSSNRSLAMDSVGYKQDRTSTVLGPEPWGSGAVPETPVPTSTTIFPEIPVADGADTIADDYDEKLSIANAILNTITVRSDVFCIWFIVNGYTPEDVQVDDGFPMVPSIAKRYVMVVDRSNVATPTTKPKIVMLREVPMP